MGKLIPIVIMAVMAFGCVPAANADVIYRLTQDDINRVYDGDTIYVDIDDLPKFIGEDLGIRIRNIDSPELRSRCDDESIKKLEREKGKLVRDRAREIFESVEYFDVVNIKMGPFSRVVADIHFPDGKSLAEILVEDKWVEPSEGSQVDWCEIIRQRQKNDTM